MLNKFAPRDWQQRLDATICRFQGIPVYVRTGDRTFQLYKLDDLNEVWKTISPTDEAFDVASCPLGYVQVKEHVAYLARRPLRKFKQGIDEKSISFSYLPDLESKPRVGSMRDIVYSKGFINMVIDKYPSLDSTLETLNKAEKPMSLAISRNVALYVMKHKVVNVYYKNELVGWIAPGEKTVHVPSDPLGWIVSNHLKGFDWTID